MRITKEGKVPYTVEWFHIKCECCDTVFQCTEYECTWTDTSGNHMFVHCPVCGRICEYETDD